MKMAQRVAQSKAALTGAVLDLLREEGADRLTITAVCRRANVTRPTFYQHYDSLEDLIGHAVADRLREHQETAFALDPDASGDEFDSALGRFLDLVWSDRRLVHVLRAGDAGGALSQRASVEAVTARILERMPGPHTPEVQLRARFTAAGTTELLGAWLATDRPDRLRDTYARLLQELANAAMGIDR